MKFTKILVFDKDRNILVLRRSSTHARLAFHPDLPGGIVEDGETFEAAAVRELDEETAIKVPTNELAVLHESTHSIGMKYVIFALYIDQIKPSVTLSWEHDQFSWADPKNVQGLDRFSQAVLNDILISHAS